MCKGVYIFGFAGSWVGVIGWSSSCLRELF